MRPLSHTARTPVAEGGIATGFHHVGRAHGQTEMRRHVGPAAETLRQPAAGEQVRCTPSVVLVARRHAAVWPGQRVTHGVRNLWAQRAQADVPADVVAGVQAPAVWALHILRIVVRHQTKMRTHRRPRAERRFQCAVTRQPAAQRVVSVLARRQRIAVRPCQRSPHCVRNLRAQRTRTHVLGAHPLVDRAPAVWAGLEVNAGHGGH